MRSLDSSKEAATIAALRRADSSLVFVADVQAFSGRLALEPAPAPLVAVVSPGHREIRKRWLGRVLAGATLVATLGGSAVAMAQGAQPGASLYGIKRVSESLWLATSIGPQDRASRLLGLAERRATEAIAAQGAGHGGLALQAAGDAGHDIRAARQIAASLPPVEQGQIDERAGNEEQRVATLLGKDPAQSGDPNIGDEGHSGGSATTPAGATGSSGSPGPKGRASPPSGTTSSGVSPGPQESGTPPGGASEGGSPDPQETGAPPSGASGPSGSSDHQGGTAPPSG